MAAKQMVFSQSARDRIAHGLDVLANTVKVTLMTEALIAERPKDDTYASAASGGEDG